MPLAMRAVSNPPNPWASSHVEWIDEPPPAKLEVFEEEARSILAHNDSPDIPQRWSLNPYRGCLHACSYCYARPSHNYLGFGAGTDFDRKIVVKVNAPELLRATFDKKSWKGESVMLSGNTDCYQALEANYRITRRCLEVFLEYRNPVGVITKGTLIRRDLDLFAEMAQRSQVAAFVSIPFADDAVRKKVEPWASSVSQRFETLRLLAERGVPCGVSVSPVIPGLNDSDIAPVLARAREAGATVAFMTLFHMAEAGMAVFDERMREAFPDRVAKIDSALVQVRRGRRTSNTPGDRMRGAGERWEIVRQVFHTQCKRLGFNEDPRFEWGETTFRRPSRQGSLF